MTTVQPIPVEVRLRRLQLVTSILLGLALLLATGGTAFTAWQAVELRAEQRYTRELTFDLCATLERAGILIQVTEENRCGR